MQEIETKPPDREHLSISQIERDLRQMLKSIDRSTPEGDYYFMSILNTLRWKHLQEGGAQ